MKKERNDSVLPCHMPSEIGRFVLLLDLEGYFVSTSKPVLEALGVVDAAVHQTNFSSFVTAAQQEEWTNTMAQVKKNTTFHGHIQICLSTKSGNFNVRLYVVRVSPLPLVLLSSELTFPQDVIKDESLQSLKENDAALAQEIRDYVLSHLEDPLPSLRKLSIEFSTNEFRLKDVFRKKFKTSIFQFYNEERLKRSLTLLLNTDYSLKTVAYMSGFNDYSNFAKAFRKRYGCNPSETSRILL